MNRSRGRRADSHALLAADAPSNSADYQLHDDDRRRSNSICQGEIRESARKFGIHDVDHIPAADLLRHIETRGAEAYVLVVGDTVGYKSRSRCQADVFTTTMTASTKERLAGDDRTALGKVHTTSSVPEIRDAAAVVLNAEDRA